MSFSVGDYVDVRYRGRNRYYPGVISGYDETSQTYSIDYTDGELEDRVPVALIQMRHPELSDTYRESARARFGESEDQGRAGQPLVPDADRELFDQSLRADLYVGLRVLARYGGGRRLYPAVISALNSDDTCFLTYDDGDIAPNAPVRDICLSNESVLLSVVGTAVMAKHGGTYKYRPGVVAAVNSNDTFDIFFFEQKELCCSIDRAHVQLRTEKNHLHEAFVGASVRCRYRGGRRAYPGSIARIHTKGTYDINYEDGDAEVDVQPDLIELQDISGGMKLGIRVWARHQQGGLYFPGLVIGTSRRGDQNYFCVRLDNGRIKREVKISEIELSNPISRYLGRHERSLNVGSSVWARWRGGRRYYRGEIMRINGDGTFNILYDDGECEWDVRSDLISINDNTSEERLSSVEEEGLFVGARVSHLRSTGGEPRCGVVVWIHDNDLYDIDFADSSDILRRVSRRELSLLPPESFDEASGNQLLTDGVDKDNREEDTAVATASVIASRSNLHDAEEDRCCICLEFPKSAAIIHGNTSHFACCYSCSVLLKQKRATCPICRLRIDAVIKCFQS